MADNTISEKQIRTMLRDARTAYASVHERSKVRRNLIVRYAPDDMQSQMGTFVPPPFAKSQLILKTVIGETAKAVQSYASRLAANTPKVSVTPQTTHSEITKTVDKNAGSQEDADMQMWEENGGRPAQWSMGMFQATDGVGYYLTLPTDADFGLPDRAYYDAATDEELDLLRKEGKLSTTKVEHPVSGKLIYAEHGDVWATRRKVASKQRAESGASLFTLEALPRDQVYVWRDRAGIKAFAVVEEIPGTECASVEEQGEGASQLPAYFAKKNGVPLDDVNLYGIWVDKEGHIVGGIEKGGPPDSQWNRPNVFTMVRFFNRIEQVVMLCPTRGTFDGAKEVYRGPHGCNRGGRASVPVAEVPMMRTGVNAPGQEFTTPMEPVFAYAPIINQIFTLLSNASTFNGIPRWVIELSDGSILRGEDGEPKIIEQGEFVPGTNPAEALGVQGTLKQVTIDVKSLQELAAMYTERLNASMPAPVMQGQSGSSAAAWQVRQLIQQGQEVLRQGVDNHALAVKQIIEFWHGWERTLDVPIYFFPAPGVRRDKHSQRNLIEIDPRNLTDSIEVVQNLDTPDEATVLLQQGIELYQGGFIDLEEFYEKYAREQDVRAAVKNNLKRQIRDYIWTGALPPLPPGAQPGEIPMVKIIGDGVRGRVFYQLIQQSPHFANQVAQDMATNAQMQQAAQANVMQPAGMGVPGMGMATTVEQQLGTNVPGGQAPPAPVMA